ncbi:PH domain-containing protein [Spirillospora sp. CA-142024]|uniref:PH domain-containing protein n=1 Tax=Spirillospora sp. CA-142024 TaxID=3240036 RepID=UPI003D90CA7D
MPPALGPEPLVLRPSTAWWLALNALSAAMLAVAVVLVAAGGTWTFLAVPFVALPIQLVVFARRASPRFRTLVDAHGVTLRRGEAEEAIPWDRIAGISIRPKGRNSPEYGLFLLTAQGESVRLPCRMLGPFTRGRRMAALAEEIRVRSGLYRNRIGVVLPGPGVRALLAVGGGAMGTAVAIVLLLPVVLLASPWTRS